jgi:hypothetical protein
MKIGRFASRGGFWRAEDSAILSVARLIGSSFSRYSGRGSDALNEARKNWRKPARARRFSYATPKLIRKTARMFLVTPILPIMPTILHLAFPLDSRSLTG